MGKRKVEAQAAPERAPAVPWWDMQLDGDEARMLQARAIVARLTRKDSGGMGPSTFERVDGVRLSVSRRRSAESIGLLLAVVDQLLELGGENASLEVTVASVREDGSAERRLGGGW